MISCAWRFSWQTDLFSLFNQIQFVSQISARRTNAPLRHLSEQTKETIEAQQDNNFDEFCQHSQVKFKVKLCHYLMASQSSTCSFDRSIYMNWIAPKWYHFRVLTNRKGHELVSQNDKTIAANKKWFWLVPLWQLVPLTPFNWGDKIIVGATPSTGNSSRRNETKQPECRNRKI